jgi:glycosyltransferase involved in cell wall biosynthesis
MRPNAHEQMLSVVVPVFNEAEGIAAFHARLAAVLDSLDLDSEVIYVNDGSRDATLARLLELRERDARIAIIDLSRNFGKELAMTAGIDQARGDAVVVIDADLQDPPELIPAFVREWRTGYDVVYGKRISRAGETPLKKLTAHLFYRVFQHASRVRIPVDTGDFRLLSRRAVEALKRLREQHRFMKGLFAWIGYKSKAVEYERDPRLAGKSSFNYWKLWNFALEGFTSFTTAPLKCATYLGLLIAFGAFVYGLVIIYDTLRYGNPVAGYPSLMVVMLFLGGVQLMSLGVIGEYLGRMFDEAKQRPLYLVQDFYPADAAAGAARAEGGEPALARGDETLGRWPHRTAV